jgi:thiamine-phosphate pyrophosphorylase
LISYLITTPEHEYESFKGADFVCFRDKKCKDIEVKASLFLSQAEKEGIEDIFLSEDYLLAKKLGFSGVHLTSRQFVFIPEAKRRGLTVIISCHSEAEIEEAIRKKVDFITYSPIFETPNKGAPKGIEDLSKMVLRYNVKIIALGGIITSEQVKEVEESGAFGFASIRYFLGA